MNISLTCLLSKAVFAHQAIRAKHNYVCVRLFWTIIETPDMSDNHDDVNDASDVTNVQTFLCTDLTLSCLVTSSRRQILGCFWRTLMYSLHLQVQSVGTIVPPPPPPPHPNNFASILNSRGQTLSNSYGLQTFVKGQKVHEQLQSVKTVVSSGHFSIFFVAKKTYR